MDLTKRYNNLERRRIDPTISQTVKLANVLKSADAKGPVGYILGAMQPVDLKSTQTLFEQAQRLFNQLETPLKENDLAIVMQLQGSVTNNTHIRYYSDIDLLTLISDAKFVSLVAPLKPTTPYLNGKSDLYKLRELSVSILKEKFPATNVDSSKPKSIKVTGGSLKGPVDVVPSNWVDTEEWEKTKNIFYRGIKILNADTGERIVNYPFKHNELIIQKGLSTNENSQKLIRFLKTLVADSKDEKVHIDISSYDICGLVYNMPNQNLITTTNSELILLKNFISYSRSLIIDYKLASMLEVPNKSRLLFSDDGLSFTELDILIDSVEIILKEAIGLGTNLYRSDVAVSKFNSLLG